MGLSEDQKAMLRVLAQREEGYEDMAALMGISVEELRARVKEALADVEEGDATAPQAAEPVPVAPPAPPAPPPAAPAPPPAAPQESAPRPEAPPAPQPAAGRRGGSRAPRLRLPKDRGALVGLAAGAAVLLIFAIVLLLSGDDSGSESSTSSGAATEGTTASSSNLTEAILAPTDGGDASGKALFGRYRKSVLLQVEADGLAASPQGKRYTVWLYRSPKVALQIGAVPVDASGKIASQFQIPAQLLAYVASGAFDQVDVALTDVAEYQAALNKAKGERKLPPYTGESVLRGQITGPAIKSQ